MKIKKHNFSAFVCAFMALSLLSFGFTSCKNEDDDDDSSVRTYKITFDTVGKTYLTSDTEKLSKNIEAVKVNSGSTFKASDISAALANYSFFEGYAISGWYFDSDYTSPFSEFTVNKSKTLYAKLTKDGSDVTVYKITYVNTEATAAITPQTSSGLITSSNYILGTGISRGINGKLFCGWYYDESYTSPVMLGDTISENKTFYAKWLNVSDLTVETPSSGVSFLQDSTNISDLAANGSLCKRKSDDKDAEVGSRIYEKNLHT